MTDTRYRDLVDAISAVESSVVRLRKSKSKSGMHGAIEYDGINLDVTIRKATKVTEHSDKFELEELYCFTFKCSNGTLTWQQNGQMEEITLRKVSFAIKKEDQVATLDIFGKHVDHSVTGFLCHWLSYSDDPVGCGQNMLMAWFVNRFIYAQVRRKTFDIVFRHVTSRTLG